MRDFATEVSIMPLRNAKIGAFTMSERTAQRRLPDRNESPLKTFFTAGISRPKNDRQAGADAPMVVIVLVMLVFGIIMM